MTAALRSLVVLLAAACALAACATSESLAPAPSGNVSPEVAEGRRLYLTCAGSCHAPEAVQKYPRVQWMTEIVPEMAHEAKLTPQQVAALKAYLHAVCTR